MLFSDKKLLYRLLLEEYCQTEGKEQEILDRIIQVRARRKFREEILNMMKDCNSEWKTILQDLAEDLGLGRYWLAKMKEGGFNQQLFVMSQLEKLAWPALSVELVPALPCVHQALVNRLYILLGRLKHPELLNNLWELQKSGFCVLWEQIGDELWVQLANRLFGKNEKDKVLALDILSYIPGRRALKLVLLFIEQKNEMLEKAWHVVLGYPSEILLKELMYQARFSPFWKVRTTALKVLLNQEEPQSPQFVSELYRNEQWRMTRHDLVNNADLEDEIISLTEEEEEEFPEVKLQVICRLLAEFLHRWKNDNEERLH